MRFIHQACLAALGTGECVSVEVVVRDTLGIAAPFTAKNVFVFFHVQLGAFEQRPGGIAGECLVKRFC